MPPKRSLARKPRQTRLTFSSMPPSSPQVRDRAAAETLDKSPSRPSKKRKLTLRKGKGRAVSDSDSDSELEAPVDGNGLSTPKKSFESNPYSPDEKALDRSMRMGLPVSTKPHGMFGSSDIEGGLSTDSSSSTAGEEQRPIKATPKKKGKKAKKAKKDEEPVVEEEEEEDDLPPPSRLRSSRATRTITLTDSELEEVPQPKHTRLLRNTRRVKDVQEDSVLGRLTREPSSSESDVMPDVTPAIRVRKQAARRQRSTSFEVEDKNVESEEEEEEVAPRSTRKRRRARESSPPDEAEVEKERSPARRLVRKKDAERDRLEQEELEDDLDFLRSSPPADKGRLRSTNGKPLNERQRALEELKRRRAGGTTVPSSSITPRRRAAVLPPDSDSDLEIINDVDGKSDQSDGNETDQDGESDVADAEEESDQSSSEHHVHAHDVFRENDDDAGFIDDDDNAPIGAPADLPNIPIQFTALSRAKPRELFKYAVEWMVQKKLNPAFDADDEIYKLAFDKLNDEVAGLANSKYSSSVWTPDFMRALRARPIADFNEIGMAIRAVEEPHCEACNRKGHPATWSVTFSEKPYHKESLEPLDEDDGSDSDSAPSSSSSESGSSPNRNPTGEKPAYDANGELVPPTSRVFTLGSTCKANALMAHTLHHWRYHLNSWVIEDLIRHGHCTPEKLVERDRWSVKKRRKYANKVVDDMERSGEIRKLHRLYKDQVDYAVEAKNEYKSGWGRRGR